MKEKCWFFLLGVNVFGLGFRSSHKDAATLCAYSCMVLPPTTSILLSAVWLVVNVKSRYLCQEVAFNQFFGRAVIGINPVTSELSVSCCYFEVDVEMNENWIIIWKILLHTGAFNILLCLSLLIFYSTQFLVTTNIYVSLYIHAVQPHQQGQGRHHKQTHRRGKHQAPQG